MYMYVCGTYTRMLFLYIHVVKEVGSFRGAQSINGHGT